MVRKLPENRRFADAGLAAHLDWQPRLEGGDGRGQLSTTIQQPSNRAWTQQDWGGPWSKMRSLRACRLSKHSAGRVAHLQDVAPHPDAPGDRTVHRRFGRLFGAVTE